MWIYNQAVGTICKYEFLFYNLCVCSNYKTTSTTLDDTTLDIMSEILY